MKTHSSIRADIIALDANDEPVLLVEVKAFTPIDEAAKQQVAANLRQAVVSNARNTVRLHIAERADTLFFAGDNAQSSELYVMFVDPRIVQVYRWEEEGFSERLFKADTAPILSFYDLEYPHKTVYEFYMITLVEAWLRDIAYHWKSENPPSFEQLKKAGLAQRLHEGTTVTEAALIV